VQGAPADPHATPADKGRATETAEMLPEHLAAAAREQLPGGKKHVGPGSGHKHKHKKYDNIKNPHRHSGAAAGTMAPTRSRAPPPRRRRAWRPRAPLQRAR